MKENEERSVAQESTGGSPEEAGARGTKRARSESRQPAVRAGDSGPLTELLSLPDLVLAPLIRCSPLIFIFFLFILFIFLYILFISYY
jgi:hypothetical protein